jgi:hypothetical protein
MSTDGKRFRIMKAISSGRLPVRLGADKGGRWHSVLSGKMISAVRR